MFAIFLGLLAGFTTLVLTRFLIGASAAEGSLLGGVLAGAGAIAIWWCVRSDQRMARTEGNPLLVTSTTLADVVVTAAAFLGGAILAGILFNANVGAAISAGLATIATWWVGRYIWRGTTTTS